MGSQGNIAVRKGLAKSVARTVVDDTSIGLRLKYIGTGTVTTVVVDTNQDITLTSSDGGAEEFLLATYTTMGLLVDAINASDQWSAKILDALRADLTSGLPFVDDAGVTISAAGYYDVLMDTDSVDYATYRCTIDTGIDTGRPSGSHKVRLQEVVYNQDISAAEANGFRIYEWDSVAKTETQVYRKKSIDTTDTTVNFASGNKTLDAGYGNDLIVRIFDTTSITDNSANFLACVFSRE